MSEEYWLALRKKIGHDRIICPGAAGAILEQGKILLIRHRATGKWQVPGGMQNLDESVTEALQREIREELNLTLQIGELVSIFSGPAWNIDLPNGDKTQQLTLFFTMTGKISDIRPQCDEVSDYAFFDLHQIPDNTFRCCQQKIHDLLHFTGKPILHC